MKNPIKQYFRKKIGRKISLLVFFILIILFSVSLYNYYVFKTNLSEESVNLMDDYIFTQSHILEDKLSLIKNDLLFIQEINCFKNYINNKNNETKAVVDNVFAEFLNGRNLYYQIRILGTDGFEEIRVENKGKGAEIIEKESLQDKSGRYYFIDINHLKDKEIYVSPFDFNIENGEVEKRVVNGKSYAVPVIRFGTPLFNNENEKVGILVINIYADELLEFIGSELDSDSLEFSLINQDGDSISIFETENFEGFSNIKYTLPEQAENILNTESGFITQDEKVLSYRKFSLKESKIDKENRQNKFVTKEDYWILMASTPKRLLFGSITELIFISFILFTSIIIIVLLLLHTSFRKIIVKPIENLSYTMRFVKHGNFKVQSEVKTGDELEDLSNELNKTIKALDNLEEEHKELDRAKTEFLSVTSHELRSPMTPMKAQLQMLLEGYLGKLTFKQKKSVETVLRNTIRLDRIIVDLLDISRIETARLKFIFKETNLKKEASDLIEEMKLYMPKKKIKLINNISNLPLITTDSTRIMQILRNLINNAIKFSDNGSEVEISANVVENNIRFKVKDKGTGINPDNKLKIFEPFFQEEHSLSRNFGGTGLGLSICKGIVESLGGKIWVVSQYNKGSTFIFHIPLKPPKEIKPVKLLSSK